MSHQVKLVVIVSPGHSGQTWLSLLIGSHSQALALGEVDVLYGMKNVDRVCMLCGEGCEFWNAFNSSWPREKNIFTALSDFSGRPILSISKMEKFRDHLAHDRLRLKLIRLVRDGRAVTASYLRKYPAWGYEEIVKKWVASSTEHDHFFLQIPPGDRIRVSYEKLVEDTTATIRNICLFIGVKYEDTMVEYWKTKHHIVDGNRGTFSFVQRHFGLESNPGDKTFYTNQDPSSFNDERWKNELSPYQLYQFQKIGGEFNERYGYTPSEGTGGLSEVAKAYLLRTSGRFRRRET